MTAIETSGYSADYTYADMHVHAYAPVLAGVMGWPTPIYAVTATDMAGIDCLYGSIGVDFKCHRRNYGNDGDPEIVLEDKLRHHPGQARWMAHIWPEQLPGTVVLVSQPDAAVWLRKNREAMTRNKHVSYDGTAFYAVPLSLLEATMPRGTALLLTVEVS